MGALKARLRRFAAARALFEMRLSRRERSQYEAAEEGKLAASRLDEYVCNAEPIDLFILKTERLAPMLVVVVVR